MENTETVGQLLKRWRERRRRSQLDLALAAEISTRHLSFVETGRARPSREMILRLAGELEIPLRERNRLLNAGGYAPAYTAKSLDDREMEAARRAIDLILEGHEPFPAIAVDRRWQMLAANRTVFLLLEGVAPPLLAPPVNVLRLSLHPEGLAPRIVNFAEWRAHLLARLARQIEATADEALETLLEELRTYQIPRVAREYSGAGDASIVVPLRIETAFGRLALISTTTVFGTPRDVTLAEIALETFFPADRATAEIFHRLGYSPAAREPVRAEKGRPLDLPAGRGVGRIE